MTRDEALQPTWRRGLTMHDRALRRGLCHDCIYSALCLSNPRMSKVRAIKLRVDAVGGTLVAAKRYVEKHMKCGTLVAP
jgi:lambda repressor-like predicted transcriptional regulator